MGKKKRGNYNQDHFKLGGSMQPGGDVVQERQKGRLTQQKKSSADKRQPKAVRHDKDTASSNG